MTHPIRVPIEGTFTTSDQTALFYRHWPAEQGVAPHKVIVMFH